MEIVKSDYIAFGYTVKVLGDIETDPSNYIKWFVHSSKFGDDKVKLEHSYSERDSHNKLHYHGVMIIKKGFYRKRLECQGYHLKLEEIYDMDGWFRYITKDQIAMEAFARQNEVQPPDDY